MSATSTLPTLTSDEVIAQLRALRTRQPVKYWAFYSSQLGGIVTDPALMVVPFDDHMVHRGHGIFDTAAIEAGKIYDLEAHLDRFIRSGKNSKLRLPRRAGPPGSGAGGRPRARVLRDDPRRAPLSRDVVHAGASRDDHDVPDQAA